MDFKFTWSVEEKCYIGSSKKFPEITSKHKEPLVVYRDMKKQMEALLKAA